MAAIASNFDDGHAEGAEASGRRGQTSRDGGRRGLDGEGRPGPAEGHEPGKD